jgi:hypothetical protein
VDETIGVLRVERDKEKLVGGSNLKTFLVEADGRGIEEDVEEIEDD